MQQDRSLLSKSVRVDFDVCLASPGLEVDEKQIERYLFIVIETRLPN